MIDLGNGVLCRPRTTIWLDERESKIVSTLVFVALSHVGLETGVPHPLEIGAAELSRICA